MTKTTKSLLAVAVAGIVVGLAFVTGVVSFRGVVWVYTILPAGAIFFGFFLISKLLEQETALYDVEQEALLASIPGAGAAGTSCREPSCRCAEPAHEKAAA